VVQQAGDEVTGGGGKRRDVVAVASGVFPVPPQAQVQVVAAAGGALEDLRQEARDEAVGG
jgi:hypothetical protein